MLGFFNGYFCTWGKYFAFLGCGSGWNRNRRKKPVRIFVSIWCYFYLLVYSVCRAIMSPLAPCMKFEKIRGPSYGSGKAAQPYIPLWLYAMVARLHVFRYKRGLKIAQ
jgi:hypothetical protein